MRGITLVTLSIAVIIILIITSTIIYNMTSNLGIGRLRDMQNDIKNLRSKVADYYAQYGDIPARKSVEYTNIGHIKSSGVISDAVDTGKFYVIELSSLDNLTLTYGQDYEQLKNGSVTDPNSLKNLYIINEASHNIFYVEGIELDNEWFYTDYTSDQIDTEAVPRRVIDGVTIPDGFYYAGGSKEEGIVISDVEGDDLSNSKGGNQFVWVPVEDYSKFQRQIGYVDSGLENTVFPLTDEVNEQGINSTFQENEIEETETTKEEAMEMYRSVKNYGGFYIGRFETGKDNGKAVVKKGVYPYDDVEWASTGDIIEDEKATTGGAIELSRAFDSENNYTNVTSTLCYGVQWDATLNFIDPNYITNAQIGSPNCAEGSYVRSQEDTGWFGSEPQNTGYIEVKHIYDMSGNVAEWTMESRSYTGRVVRGGNFSVTYASTRAFPLGGVPGGFRICLFVNPTEEEDSGVDGVKIPEGFTHVTGDTKEEGIVVADSLGNEYVWVPVTKNEDGTPTDPYVSTNGKLRQGSDIEIQLGRYSFGNSFFNEYAEEDLGYDNMPAKSISDFKESVASNGGYLIARYEAGTEGGTLIETGNPENSLDWTGYAGENMQLVSKRGATVWGYITQNRAANLCRELADKNKYIEMTSDLINSYAWDTAIMYMQACGTDSNYAKQPGMATPNRPSKAGEAILAEGNGANENDVQCNIYDMAGNYREWSTESRGYDPDYSCVVRGGNYGYNGGDASNRLVTLGTFTGVNISFRPILYLNI